VTRPAAAGCPVEPDFDPLGPHYLADPYAVLAALPVAEAPVFYAPTIDYYVVTRYADIEEVYRDPLTYSAAVAQAWSPATATAPEPSATAAPGRFSSRSPRRSEPGR